jgi:hypothetical protein
MIVVNVELKSAIHSSRDRMLGRVEIANVGGGRTRGDYEVRVYDRGGRHFKTASVKNWPRLQKSALRLVARAFEVAFNDRDQLEPADAPALRPPKGRRQGHPQAPQRLPR